MCDLKEDTTTDETIVEIHVVSEVETIIIVHLISRGHLILKRLARSTELGIVKTNVVKILRTSQKRKRGGRNANNANNVRNPIIRT